MRTPFFAAIFLAAQSVFAGTDDGDRCALLYSLQNFVQVSNAPKKPNHFSETLARYEAAERRATREEVVEAAMAWMETNGISYDIIPSRVYKGRDRIPPAADLYGVVIRPDSHPSAHPVSQIAAMLKRDQDIDLVYDFRFMKEKNFNGAFSGPLKKIYISNEFIDRLGVDGTFLHEIEHAYLNYLRDSGQKDNIFNTVLKTRAGDEVVRGYDGYMNFEEMLNHPLSVRIAAWELARPEVAGGKTFAEKLTELKGRIGVAERVVRIAKEDLPANIAALRSGRVGVDLSKEGDRLLVYTEAKPPGLPATVTILDRDLIARFRRRDPSAAQDATQMAYRRLDKLLSLAFSQERALNEMSQVLRGTVTPSDAKNLEKNAKAILKRALSEVETNRPAKNEAAAIPTVTRASSGADLVQRQRAVFDRLLSTSGFSSLEDLQKAVDRAAEKSPEIRRIRDAIRANRMEVSMYRNSRSRLLILKDGLLNSHQTGRSGGDLSIERRRLAESSYLGMSLDDYQRVEDKAKPKYFVLRYPWETDAPAGSTYGDDIYIYTAAQLQDRLTFALGDSLDKIPLMPGNPVEKGWQAQAWDQLFVPWKYRELMIPELLPGYQKSQILQLPIESSVPNLRNFMNKEGLDSFLKYQKSIKQNNAPYVEVQGYGQFDVPGLTGFQFNKTPPSGKFLQALLDLKKPILDGRSGRRVLWKPSEEEKARLLAQVDEPNSAVRKFTKESLASSFHPDDRVRVKWMRGTQSTGGLGWANRVYRKDGKDFLEITQSYGGDEHINVSIPVQDIVEFKNLTPQ